MRAKALKKVHIRQGTPHIKPDNKKGIIYAGFTIDIAHEVRGEKIENNNIWYEDKNGDYYWSGGFEKLTVKEQENTSRLQSNLKKNINIAILDSGIEASHESIEKKIVFAKNLTDETEIRNSHGTKVAGIIVANQKLTNELTTDTSLYDFQVIENSGRVNRSAVDKALAKIINNNFNIQLVNMSFDINANSFAKVQGAINQLYKQNVLCIIAADSIVNQRLKNVIKVTCNSEPSITIEDQSISIAFINTPIYSTSTNQSFDNFENSSAYTALTTAIIAKIISSYGLHYSIDIKEIGKHLSNYLKENKYI